MKDEFYAEITPAIMKLSRLYNAADTIASELYAIHDVKRGLRDIDGRGVVAGLTEISTVNSKKLINGVEVPCEGELFYRGENINDLVNGFVSENRFGFEEIAYLLLFGQLPNAEALDTIHNVFADCQKQLPNHFVRDIIMTSPSPDMMNVLARSVLTLYAFDDRADDISMPNVLRQCLQIISMLPLLSVYGYHTYQHYYNGQSLYIHAPEYELTYAENILHTLRKDSQYTELEARVLDMALVLHMEHGGGNNSTFTTHVVTSSGTDTYSSFAASLGSLKGPRHGGANIKVVKMMNDLKEHVVDWTDREAVRNYLCAILSKDAFDHSGLIYGIGHAVYSLSDPRAQILKRYVEKLSEEKNRKDEFALYCLVEELAPQVIAEKNKIYKGVSANVDFYSGFVYSMLNLPLELYTPIFAIARSIGWSAHRMEELKNKHKIIRPAYISVSEEKEYLPLSRR